MKRDDTSWWFWFFISWLFWFSIVFMIVVVCSGCCVRPGVRTTTYIYDTRTTGPRTYCYPRNKFRRTYLRGSNPVYKRGVWRAPWRQSRRAPRWWERRGCKR